MIEAALMVSQLSDFEIDETAETKAWLPDAKAALWKAVDRIATSWESSFSKAAVRAFEADKRNCLALVTGAKQKALQRKASVDWAEVTKDVAHYLETEGGDQWREKFTPMIQGVMKDQGERWAVTLGLEFNVNNFFASNWFNHYTLTFAQPINDTTLAELSTLLQQAEQEGWSVPTTQQRMTKMFEQWAQGNIPPEEFDWYTQRMPPHRTEMIARTETMRASNAGSNELFNEWGVKKHEWLSTQDDRTREAHLSVNIDPKVVPIDEPFVVMGEELMYPGDPAGSPSNTINCRCTVLPVME